MLIKDSFSVGVGCSSLRSVEMGVYIFTISFCSDISVRHFFFFLSKHPKPRSVHLKWRRKLPPQLPPQLPCQPRKSLSLPQHLQSLNPLLPLPHLPMGEMNLVSWRSTSLIWDPSLALTTGSSTPPEESLVWYSTDQLNTPLLPVCAHTLLFCSPVNLLSFQLPLPHGYFT